MSSHTPVEEYPYPRIRRISQACLNCRRKKARCSGSRPACSNCRRLSQTCRYQDGGGTQANSGQEKPQHDSDESVDYQSRQSNVDSPTISRIVDTTSLIRTNQDPLTTRIAAVEGKLDELLLTMQKFLPLLQNQQLNPPVVSPTDIQPDKIAPSHSTGVLQDPKNTYQQMQCSGSSFDDLPPPQVASSLIDLYFSRCHNQPYSFFHEQSFRQRYSNGLVPQYLIFAILASALRFSTDPFYQPRPQVAIMAYASRSWSYIVQEWFATESDPDLQICQTITLLSIIDFTAGRRHPGWMKIGLCIRIAQDLRLMLEPDSELDFFEQEERRRVFWSIYVLDKLCSCGRARPSAIIDAQCQVQLPGHELDFRNGVWKKTQTLKQAFASAESQDEHPSHFALVVLVASIIGKCAQYMIHDHGRSEGSLPPWDSKSDFAMIHSTLLQLETQFEIGNSIEDAVLAQECRVEGIYDMQIAGPTIFAYAIFYTAQCLLHHPFLLYQQSKSRGVKPPASFLNRALQSGRENAYLMSKLLVDAEAMGCAVGYSYFGYCTTVCASIHTMYLNDQNIEHCDQARKCLATEKLFLEKYSQSWPNGNIMVGIIEKLASQPSLILAVLAATPRFELLDREQVVDLWAAVDYTTMTQKLTRPALRSSMEAPSPDWESVFGITENMGLSGNSNHSDMPGSAQALHERSISHGGLVHPAMSPFSTFFNDTTMNFGA